LPFRLAISETDGDGVREAEAVVQGEFKARRFVDESGEVVEPGLAAIRASTCLSCHAEFTASAGPAYRDVALKYRNDPEAPKKLTSKILQGGAGVWGQIPMPPHPAHTETEVRGMVDWILSLSAVEALAVSKGAEGVFHAPAKPGEGSRTGEGILLLTASYTDDGKGGTLPRLRGEHTIVLHSRRKKAALCDANHGMAAVEQVEGETGLIGRFPDGAAIIFRDVNLSGITRVTVRAGSFKAGEARLELRKKNPAGELMASIVLPETGEGTFHEIPVGIEAAGLTDVCVVARCGNQGEAGLNWIEFR
jgi:cytochrome c